MKKLFTILALTALSSLMHAQNQNEWWNADSTYLVPITEAGISAARPMREIGVQRTRLDSVALRENIALSMADVLTFNSSIFVKQYGRGSLSTVAFRGTSASHTQVSWNGMKLNSPMLGMTDFSTIPSYFIDDASLLHGSSSVGVSGGGLGGAVVLSTKPAEHNGTGFTFIQGLGSFGTYDEFLKFTFGNRTWKSSTRIVYTHSDNDFTYRNYNKKVHTYDENHNIIGSHYPIDTNKCGSLKDFHILQELYYTPEDGNRIGLSAWYMNSIRGVPLLSVDYRGASYINSQSENTFRGIASWDKTKALNSIRTKAGYIHTRQGYDFARDKGNGSMIKMVESRSVINTIYGQIQWEYTPSSKWYFSAEIDAYQHFVQSTDRNATALSQNKEHQGNIETIKIGYNQARFEALSSISAKWSPVPRLGLSAIFREELYGDTFTPLIPAFFADYLVSEKGNVRLKASVSRNYRFPSLNDLYFVPGGNPSLKPEKGFTYDAGATFAITSDNRYSINGEIAWFDSYIDDWIVWIPTFKGYWTPQNVKQVHAYGIESKGNMKIQLSKKWQANLSGSFSWTPSINHGDPACWADEAIGKQLVYVPLYSASFNGALIWDSWRLSYKWCWYSERYTTSDNDIKTKIGRILPYFMNDVVLEKTMTSKFADFSFKIAVNNLFNEEYESVLNRPMPGRNYELFIEIKPRFR